MTSPSPTPAYPPQSPVATAGAYERLRILNENKTIAMVGLSPDPMRPSHFAAIYMLAHGYDVIPVNPRAAGGEILGQTVYASLADIPRPVGIVDVFRKPEDIDQHVEDLLAKKPRAVWFQLGIRNDAAAEKLARAGIQVVQDRCMKIEHHRLDEE